MSDPVLDALAETARNRGLKLVRSRVRSPGKRRFGKVGLTDKAGEAVFGMDDKGPNAKPEDVEHYLRNLGAKDWGASLDVAVMPRKRKAKPRREAANDAEPAAQPKAPKEKPPKPRPEPVLKIRQAKPGDAARLVELMKLLGHEVTEKGVRKRIAALGKAKLPQIVATLDKQVVGLVGIHAMTAIHRDKPVGRITILVVDESARDKGIGRMLTEAAEKELRKLGCGLLEITSNDRLSRAHSFYRHLGYERTSMRFCKQL
ncbi:GNAT family N-acetyltransferase [Sphingomonas hankyongi]|uniref:GNAT family N-acetyltransferase n=1 Tax=Sphingomonas hankyongi TaxID=2908209 RepID=A0ABT0RZI3_9SPHN|nr:GNAT family N-acetyltransferase [Sphingomonas hankyongi]MCL6729017.1 GNAT family N-acetyltransferase [Sphingomonas hankyongi]